MNHAYILPREKLSEKGVAALSDTELLQVIISSGTRATPVARIARKLNGLFLSKPDVALQDILAVPGIGVVKAGQVIAAIEYGKRMSRSDGTVSQSVAAVAEGLRSAVALSRKPILAYAFVDGAGRVLDEDQVELEAYKSRVLLVNRLFERAVRVSASSMHMALGSKDHVEELSLSELAIIKDICSTARIISIVVTGIELVNKDSAHSLKASEYV